MWEFALFLCIVINVHCESSVLGPWTFFRALEKDCNRGCWESPATSFCMGKMTKMEYQFPRTEWVLNCETREGSLSGISEHPRWKKNEISAICPELQKDFSTLRQLCLTRFWMISLLRWHRPDSGWEGGTGISQPYCLKNSRLGLMMAKFNGLKQRDFYQNA